jgi:predicted HAD superfamily Cof-like phosphohydrolase
MTTITPRGALHLARDQFELYATEHEAKANPSSPKFTGHVLASSAMAKAATNRQMVSAMDEALKGLDAENPSFGHGFADSFRTIGEVRTAAFSLSGMQADGTPAAHLATRLHDSICAMLRGDRYITAQQVRDALQGAGDLAETAFGPADAPGLPLGLRYHPRYAIRFTQRAASGEIEDLGVVYAHTSPATHALLRMLPKGEVESVEKWDGKAWIELFGVHDDAVRGVPAVGEGPYRQGSISIGYDHGLDEALADVAEFHKALAPDLIASHPRMLTFDEATRRAEWMDSEVRELLIDTPSDAEVSMRHAIGNHIVDIDTMAQQIDAAMDVIYFALGIPMEMGLNAAPFWRLAHGANMAKLHTKADGTKYAVRREGDNKVVKPEGWTDPHAAIVEEIKRQVMAAPMAIDEEHYALRYAIRRLGPPEGYVDAEGEG